MASLPRGPGQRDATGALACPGSSPPGDVTDRSPSGPRGPAAGSERQRGLAIWLLNIRPCPGSLEGRGKRKRPFLRITE